MKEPQPGKDHAGKSDSAQLECLGEQRVAGGKIGIFFILLGVREGIVAALWSGCTDFAHLLYERGVNR